MNANPVLIVSITRGTIGQWHYSRTCSRDACAASNITEHTLVYEEKRLERLKAGFTSTKFVDLVAVPRLVTDSYEPGYNLNIQPYTRPSERVST